MGILSEGIFMNKVNSIPFLLRHVKVVVIPPHPKFRRCIGSSGPGAYVWFLLVYLWATRGNSYFLQRN